MKDTNTSEKTVCGIMDYDKIIEHIGETSTWNLINLGLLWLPPIMAGALLLQTSFTGYSSALYVMGNKGK